MLRDVLSLHFLEEEGKILLNAYYFNIIQLYSVDNEYRSEISHALTPLAMNFVFGITAQLKPNLNYLLRLYAYLQVIGRCKQSAIILFNI